MVNGRSTTLYLKKETAHKIRAVERATGLSREELFDWLLHKAKLVEASSRLKWSKAALELEGTEEIRKMIKNNLKR